MSKILIVLSAADTWTRADGSKYQSGVWAEEFVVMDERFVAAGCTVDIATPGGVVPTIDPHSMNPAVVGQENVDHFRSYLDKIAARLAKPLVLAEVDASRYDAIVIPGGHGPVEDLYKDADMGRILAEADRMKKIIAPVCHGQAALLAAKDADGNWLFKGRKMTSFSDEEEVELGTADNAPWLLADTLRNCGAEYEKGANWGAYIVRDGNLLSGQNPASSAPLADAVLEALRWTQTWDNGFVGPCGEAVVPPHSGTAITDNVLDQRPHEGVVTNGSDGAVGPKPFYILIEALPGREAGVIHMLRDILACV